MPRTTCTIEIYEDIGGFGTSCRALADALKADGDRVDVLINSRGGDVLEGLGMYNMLRAESKKRPVTCTVMGAAASMASVIAVAADKVRMYDNALMMLHNPQGFADVLLMGDAAEMREAAADLEKQAQVLDFLRGRLVAAYQRGGRAADVDWIGVLAAETWLDAEQARELGLVDEIIPAPKDAPRACLSRRQLASLPQHVRERMAPPPGRMMQAALAYLRAAFPPTDMTRSQSNGR